MKLLRAQWRDHVCRRVWIFVAVFSILNMTWVMTGAGGEYAGPGADYRPGRCHLTDTCNQP